jgi:tRNA pseudouridine38-40 synthase
MHAGAAGFVGRHDFRAFADADPDEKSTVVVLDEVKVAEAGPLVLVRVAGSHFLWKMVRRMVGVLVAAGTGALPAQRIDDWLTAPGSAGGDAPATLTAPAAGLFLERVFYDGEAWPEPLRPPLGIR